MTDSERHSGRESDSGGGRIGRRWCAGSNSGVDSAADVGDRRRIRTDGGEIALIFPRGTVFGQVRGGDALKAKLDDLPDAGDTKIEFGAVRTRDRGLSSLVRRENHEDPDGTITARVKAIRDYVVIAEEFDKNTFQHRWSENGFEIRTEHGWTVPTTFELRRLYHGDSIYVYVDGTFRTLYDGTRDG